MPAPFRKTRSAADDRNAQRDHDDRGDEKYEPCRADTGKDHTQAERNGAQTAQTAILEAAVRTASRLIQNRHPHSLKLAR